MALKFVILFALLAMAHAGSIVTPVSAYAASPLFTKFVSPGVDAVASTQQNVVRSYGGTVSTYSKSVDTPYSSVHKTDTRINNNVYTPALAKTVSYSAPPAVYAAHSPAVYASPAHTQTVYAASSLHSAPAVTTNLYTQQSPVVYTHESPVVSKSLYTQQIPAVYSHDAPAALNAVSYTAPAAATNINHGPTATTYTHNTPGVSGYGSSQTIHYSPAEMVSHMTFDGFGTHWGF